MLLLAGGKLFRISVRHRRATSAPRSSSGGQHCRSANGRLGFVSISNVTLFAGIALCTATFVGGSGYLIRELHRQVAGASALAGLPAPTVEQSPSIEITAEMLHVSSIALGRVPLAIVNGTSITEGASLEINTAGGKATLRVTGIVDGAVQFKCGSQTISASLQKAFPRKGVAK